MQLILKSAKIGGSGVISITGEDARKVMNLSALAKAFNVNKNSLSTLVNRDGMNVEEALIKLITAKEY